MISVMSKGARMAKVEAQHQRTWRQLVRWAAIAAMVEYLVVMAAAKGVIPPVILIFLVLLAGVVLLRRPARKGVVVTLVGLVLFLASDVILGGSNFSTPRSFPSWAIALAALVTGLVGIASAVATLRGKTGGTAPLTTAWVAGGLIVLATAGNILGSLTFKNASREAGDVIVTAKDTKFGPSTLVVSAGPVTFFLDNKDLQLHNFHIKGVGSAVLLPASHSTRHTFDLRPGTYSFVCDFHTPNMKGTLTVR
jgi:plastocyanin